MGWASTLRHGSKTLRERRQPVCWRRLAGFTTPSSRAVGESRLAEAHGDEPPGGDAAEYVLARFARAEEEGESVAAAELQQGGGA
jgi:hypothetical protein